MPGLKGLSDNHGTFHTIGEVGTSGLHPVPGTQRSTHAFHPHGQSRRARMPATNGDPSETASDSYENAASLQSKTSVAIKAPRTPESSPERPSHTSKAGNGLTRSIPSALLTPPPSDDENDCSSGTAVSESDHSLELPLDRRPLPTTHYSTPLVSQRKDQTPSRRITSAGKRRLATKPSTDRFITTRPSAYDFSYTFRASKAAQDLTKSEKLLRDTSACPDPFGPLIFPRIREQRANGFRVRGGLAQSHRLRSRTMGALNTIGLPQDVSAPQNRQVSAGAVWNVGGSGQIGQPGPVRAVPNGRGGFFSSGSNAPMYTADFLDQRSPGQEIETLEHRVARALDIDRTERLIHTNRSTGESRRASTGSVGLRPSQIQAGPRTEWINGEWYQSSSPRECQLSGT